MGNGGAGAGWMLGAGPGDWRAGGTAWTVDYPEGDRTFARLLERLTTIDVRLVEQPVNLDDDIDAYYWPFLISGLVGAWDLTDAQARETAAGIWERINEPNLLRNVLPTRERATLVLTKGADHAVTNIRLRRL